MAAIHRLAGPGQQEGEEYSLKSTPVGALLSFVDNGFSLRTIDSVASPTTR